jgi:protein TonB
VKPKAVNTPKALAETPVVESKVADAVTTAASSVAPSSTAESASGGGGNGVGTGLGGSGSMDPRALYTGRILQLVQSQVEYPRSAKVLGREGTVLVEVKVARDGSILSTKIKKKADFDAFNKNALETFKRVGKFEPVPAEFGREELTVLLPVKYFIRNL